jgi:hypothetical protein
LHGEIPEHLRHHRDDVYSLQRLKASERLVPPKLKEFESAISISASCGGDRPWPPIEARGTAGLK